jgi:hypothetical protein
MRSSVLLAASVALPLLASVDPGPFARLFALPGEQNIVGESDFGIVNGYLTVGTPYRNAMAISRAFAPPYASSDFLLELWLFGERVPVSRYEWLPVEVRREGTLKGIAVSTRTILVPGRRGAILEVMLHNTLRAPATIPVRFSVGGSLESVQTWDFSRPDTAKHKTSAMAAGNKVILENQDGAIAVGADVPNLQWEPWSFQWASEINLAAGQTKVFHAVLSLDQKEKALAVCDELLREPAKWIAYAVADFEARAAALFSKVPRLHSSDKKLESFYNRSVLHFLLDQWHVPEFKLHPYYGTGAVLGGTLASYLWDFGEPWELFPLYDPDSTKSHIKAFLSIDLTAHFSFDPMTGKGLGPFYPVNQEKIIGLIYFYVLNTGDTRFLSERVNGRTVLEWAIQNATWGDDVNKPVALIDYGDGNHHLELRHDLRYDFVLPDLNGRRYLNYLRAEELAGMAGADASYLGSRAKDLKALLKAELWSEHDRWFYLKTNVGKKDLRYTVQMFKLIGSPVLDKDQEEGLLSHLNEREFLSPFGLHSMSKQDPAYDQVDFDNGGGGCFVAFPAQIAERLYSVGRDRAAADILSRILWWGERTPYWGDSFAANYIEYRKDTPLQSTFDASAAAQAIVFGMFGIHAVTSGEIHINPHPPSFSPSITLTGVKLRGHEFDVAANPNTFSVTSDGRTLTSRIGTEIVIPARP